MTPKIVHRYSFPTREVIELLLDGHVGDCEGWAIRIAGSDLEIDVIGPAIASNEAAKSYVAPPEKGEEPPAREPEPEIKGGPLARRAAICCGEGAFRIFLNVGSAEAAKAEICRRCGVDSRKLLDHDERAGAIWRQIDRKYHLWLDGNDDVSLD